MQAPEIESSLPSDDDIMTAVFPQMRNCEVYHQTISAAKSHSRVLAAFQI